MLWRFEKLPRERVEITGRPRVRAVMACKRSYGYQANRENDVVNGSPGGCLTKIGEEELKEYL